MADQMLPDVAEIFHSYSSLLSTTPNPGGLLVFYGGLDRKSIAAMVAANVAGAASLVVDAEGSRAKQALRQGVCDFVVNTLDEALRILKNEIRKQQPVSVSLVGDPVEVAAEMLERGVQPDLVIQKDSYSEEFLKRGAQVLPQSEIEEDSHAITWSVSQNAAKWLPLVDAIAMEILKDNTRVKWLQLAPRYLPKQLSRERYVRMTADEHAKFVALLRQHVQSGEIAASVDVLCDGQPTH
ncbi:MAG TPA: hypothetical protein VHB45_13505 [Alloacidobacterium sp.]|nr:hypothetical protein [Alloacidobacterium sp.]